MRVYIYTLLFSLLFLSSCCTNKKEYDQFIDEELQWLPYSIGDSLWFESDLDNSEYWVVTDCHKVETSYGIYCDRRYFDEQQFDFLLSTDSTNRSKHFILNRNINGDFEMNVKTGSVNGSSGNVLQSTLDTMIIKLDERADSDLTFVRGIGLDSYIKLETNEIFRRID